MTHRSLANETGQDAGDYERLEFLGDAVLGLLVAERLYRRFPQASEGALTVMRSELVRRSSLAAWARRFHLGDFLVLGKGEERAGGRDKDGVLSACFEAVIGALYLDRGQRVVRTLIDPLIAQSVPEISAMHHAGDAKSALQRRAQTVAGHLPTYRVVEVSGPSHRPTFTVEATVLPGLSAQGVGPNKRFAEQDAAERLLALWAEQDLGVDGDAVAHEVEQPR